MNYDDVIPLNEIGKIETVEVYNQAYVDKQQKRITELGELLNSTLEENKDIYKKMADLDTALEDCTESLTDARIKIKELEKENTELKDKLKNLESVAEVRLANWQKYEEENIKLKAQIEKMKDCLNKWYKQHNDDDYTETFYDNLLRDTEKCLWGDSVND